jgi:hypothetical protein
LSRVSDRSTYAIDADTVHRLNRLALAWGVSQAEVIRRSVQRAAEQTEGAALSPADVVARYTRGPLPRTAEATRVLVESLRGLRHDDDERRRDPAPNSRP